VKEGEEEIRVKYKERGKGKKTPAKEPKGRGFMAKNGRGR